MRRAVTAAVVSVLVLGGAAATPAFAAEHGAGQPAGTGKAQPAVHAKARASESRTSRPEPARAETTKAKTTKAKTGTLKTVTYRGYQFKVPASWPVYRLSEHPSTCVRYDISAVYLGTPGVNMECPAGLIGRTQTISIIPSTTIAAGSGSEITYQRDQPDGVGGTRVRSLKAVHAAVTQDAAEHELRVAVNAAALGATALATYGTDPALVERVLASLRVAPKNAAASARTPAPAAARGAGVTTGRPARSGTAPATATASSAQPASTGWPGLPPGWPVQIVSPPKKPQPVVHPVSGFDSCAAPSLDAMQAWRSDYAAIGVYIGGLNTGCAFGNMSAAWLKSVEGMHWGVMPTYVGLQAPCYSGSVPVWEIVPGKAAAEGTWAGQDAVRDARIFGLAAGSPIYYDMEGYNANDHACVTAVLNFLGAWDRAVSAADYETAVYSSLDSGIENMQTAAVNKTPGFTAPDALWIASWDGTRSLNIGLPLAWPLAYRSKQYEGDIWQTIGGYRQNIDLDVVGGPVAR